MGIVILIGPSGVGKTSLGGRVSKMLRCGFIEMDKVWDDAKNKAGLAPIVENESRSASIGLDLARDYIKKYNEDKSNHILDFGAGFLNLPDDFYKLIQIYQRRAITIWGDETKVHERLIQNRLATYPKEDFLAQEYSSPRKEIYNLSENILSTTDNENKDIRALADLIKSRIDKGFDQRHIFQKIFDFLRGGSR